MPTIAIDDNTRIYYEEYGSGDRYVFCSQIDHDYTSFSFERELSRRGFHVFLLTDRGYGKSSHTAENFGLIQPAGGSDIGGKVANRRSTGTLWTLTVLFALFCLALWSLHLRRGAVQRVDGGVEPAPLSRRETEAAVREHLASPPPQVRQSILETIQKDTQ